FAGLTLWSFTSRMLLSFYAADALRPRFRLSRNSIRIIRAGLLPRQSRPRRQREHEQPEPCRCQNTRRPIGQQVEQRLRLIGVRSEIARRYAREHGKANAPEFPRLPRV